MEEGGRPLDPSTLVVTAGRPPAAPGAPLNVGVELSSTFRSGAPRTYGRARNATWEAFEDAVGELEGGRAVAFASGLAAVSAVLAAVRPTHLVIDHGAYHGSRALAADLAGRGLLEVCVVDTTNVAATASACGAGGLLWLESPTNPTMEVVDLAALAAAAGTAGATVAVDNTFATPLLQRPLALGADVVVHSATKLLSGHSDVVLGVAVAGDDHLAEALVAHRTGHGAVPGPMEAFLALRGLRTLAVRLGRAQHTASLLAGRLDAHPAVERVRWPGLPDHPGHELAVRQMEGPGTMLAFDVAGGAGPAEKVCAALRLVVNATSLGGVETLVERRSKYPGEDAVPPGLLRVSVGLEHPEDLWDDLAQALDGLR